MKHLLSDLELKELRSGEIGWRDSLTVTPSALVDEPPLSAENLQTDIQALQQKIMNHLPTEHRQRSYIPKLKDVITDRILA